MHRKLEKNKIWLTDEGVEIDFIEVRKTILSGKNEGKRKLLKMRRKIALLTIILHIKKAPPHADCLPMPGSLPRRMACKACKTGLIGFTSLKVV